MNTGDYNGTLQATGVDPSLVSVDLEGFQTDDCSDEALVTQETPFELAPYGAWQTLSGMLPNSTSLQSVRVRWSVLEDDIAGFQSTGVRLVQWDNFLLRAL
jgi:hypothetical protein